MAAASRKGKGPAQPTREERVRAIAASWGSHTGDLLVRARQALEDLNAAVIAADHLGAQAAQDRYETTVYLLNGETFLGCLAGPEAAGNRIRQHCAAVPGAIPIWGQQGEFLIEQDGARGVVQTAAGMSGWGDFRFYAVDDGRPFVSETGFLAHCPGLAPLGLSVEQSAQAVFRQALKDRRTVLSHRGRTHRGDFAWLTLDDAAAIVAVDEQGGQLGFAF